MLKKVEIVWVDAEGDSGWIERKRVIKRAKNTEGLKVTSIGYIIAETNKTITLVQSVDEINDNVDNYIIIPKTAVTKRKLL